MKKKTYIAPEMEVISIKKPQLLAGSQQVPVGGTTDQQLAPGMDFDFDDEDY